MKQICFIKSFFSILGVQCADLYGGSKSRVGHAEVPYPRVMAWYQPAKGWRLDWKSGGDQCIQYAGLSVVCQSVVCQSAVTSGLRFAGLQSKKVGNHRARVQLLVTARSCEYCVDGCSQHWLFHLL